MFDEIKRIADLNIKIHGDNSQFNESQKRSIRDIYEKFFSSTSKQFQSGCNACYVDAWVQIKSLNNNPLKLKAMAAKQFKIKENTILQMHGHPGVFTNANLTDDAAFSFLAKNKKMIGNFDVFPSDWEKQLENWKDAQPVKEKKEINPAPVVDPEKIATEKKAASLAKFKENVDSLSKKELREMANENKLPKEEWNKMNVEELINYLAEKLHETITHGE